MNSIEKAKVLVIGAGPAGVGVAVGLARRGIKPIILVDRSEKVGGVPSLYQRKPGGVPTFVLWTRGRLVSGGQVAEHLTHMLQDSKVEVWVETQVTEIAPNAKTTTLVNPSCGKFQVSAEAVVLACGAREKTPAERGWIFGSRSSGVLSTKNLLDLVNQNGFRVDRNPVILGSDLIAYSAAANLKLAGAPEVVMVDRSRKPGCSLPTRFYFGRWTRPRYTGAVQAVTVTGSHSISTVTPANGAPIGCGLLLICGDLVPNTELALMGNLRVDLASRSAAVGSDYQLSEPGWFAAGNILGNYHGAEWCYFNGRYVARQVAKYLGRSQAAV